MIRQHRPGINDANLPDADNVGAGTRSGEGPWVIGDEPPYTWRHVNDFAIGWVEFVIELDFRHDGQDVRGDIIKQIGPTVDDRVVVKLPG